MTRKAGRCGPFLMALADDFARENRQMIRTVERVGSQAEHIVDIVRAQRGSDSRAMTCKDVDLRQAIFEALRILQSSLARRGIRTHVNCGDAPEEVRIQESQFNQMLVNLLKNAMEAIDELKQSGGLEGPPRIEIRARVRQAFLLLEVEDNGVGIDRKNFNAIFRAGYTTKPDGSGLGLHSAANFVTGHRGKNPTPERGRGTAPPARHGAAGFGRSGGRRHAGNRFLRSTLRALPTLRINHPCLAGTLGRA